MTSHSYYVVMIDYGRRGRQAIVDPEMTRRSVVDRIRSGDYSNIVFIHEITMNDAPRDVTSELTMEAAIDAPLSPADRLANTWDHARKLRAEA